MGKLILCKGRKADNPFFIRCIEKNVYTMEELCFFFYHEMYFVEEFYDWAELAGWLKREMHMDELAKEIQRLVVGYDTKLQMVQLLLENAHFVSGEELLEYEKKMIDIHKSTGLLRTKKRADYLVRSNKFQQAIELYMQILNSNSKPDDELKADIYHNLGVVYGRLFYFEKAADFFLKSFDLVPSRESLKQYKLALKLAEKDVQENNEVLDLPSVIQLNAILDDEIQSIKDNEIKEKGIVSKLQSLKQNGKVSDYYDKIDETLGNWKEVCRSYM